MTERELIGRKIADIRNEKNYSIRELADKCSVNFSNIGKIERGAYNVSIDILSRVANAMGCEIAFVNRSLLRQFVFDNQMRDDVIGDLCSDLLKNKEFLDLTSENEQREKIINIGVNHPYIQDAIVQLFLEYNGEEINFKEQ